jgi:DNA-binding response OmpR family regulator
LEEAGLAVTVAVDGLEGDRPPQDTACDVIIVGPLPPRGGDPRLVRRWRSQGLRTPVLLLTAGGSGTAPEGDDSLSVPCGLDELLSRVRALARGSEFPKPA